MKSAKSNIRGRKTPLKTGKVLFKNEEHEKKQDPVEVYCRIRPLITSTDHVCISLTSSDKVTLTPPDSIRSRKKLEYGFKHVFTEHSTQKQLFECIAAPLLEGLLQGKNGLLFTYGVTGSGKTFTMTGEPNDPGLMPRCINTLFNTISAHQTPKYIIKSDKMNSFEIQSPTDALGDRLRESKTKPKSVLKNKYAADICMITNYKNDGVKLNLIQKNCMYAVFVNYIEIYNNTVYDLMDDTGGVKLQPKILREDWSHNMYVNGVVEVEVKSAEEAFELFNIGQKRKRMAHTSMNSESSRSHSIFTIRLVQGIFDATGEYLASATDNLIVAQLSLVDLAGSERCSRTNTTGQRLKEAGSINTSLMSLRTCLETLRENQMQGTNRLVPYRDSRLTHLFKNYFDGEGKVEMIVCVNPSMNDYDETLQVMKFAEITQEVKVARAEAKEVCEDVEQKKKIIKVDDTPKVNRQKLKMLIKKGLLPTTFTRAAGPEVIKDFLMFVKSRSEKKREQRSHVFKKRDDFRQKLSKLNKDRIVLKSEITSLSTLIRKKRDVFDKLQSDKLNMQVTCDTLRSRCQQKDQMIEKLENNIKEINFKLNQNTIDKEAEKRKIEEKMTQEFDVKFRYQRDVLTAAMKEETEKIELVKDILMNEPVIPKPELYTVRSQVTLKNNMRPQDDCMDMSMDERRIDHLSRKIAPPANVRYRRSKSAGDVWLEHKPLNPTPLGTILQPVINRRKSVTKLTDVKDVVNPKQTKYLLIDQGQDDIGELETKFYKGDIIPTCSGGAQIIFDDVEKLKQESPTAGTPRNHLKRNYLHISDTVISDKKPRQ